MSGVAVLSGSLYTWGKGEHEKSKESDYIEFSSPKLLMEQKGIVHLAFGVSHVMALDKYTTLYALGDGQKGCLGFIDGKKRYTPQLVQFFYNKRILDVACGNNFTVVIAEVEGDPNKQGKVGYSDDLLLIKKSDAKSGLVFDQNKALVDDSVLKPNR